MRRHRDATLFRYPQAFLFQADQTLIENGQIAVSYDALQQMINFRHLQSMGSNSRTKPEFSTDNDRKRPRLYAFTADDDQVTKFVRCGDLSHHSQVMRFLAGILVLILLGMASLSAVAADSRAQERTVVRPKPLQLWKHLDDGQLKLASESVVVLDRFGNGLVERNAEQSMSIASVTKLMSAMVLLDANLPMAYPLTITSADKDRLKHSGSRLAVGTKLSREDLLLISLMASENRATAALARDFPGGTEAFVRRMNLKAKLLGMTDTHFADPTGLDPRNVSTARDLARLVRATYRYPAIRRATTRASAKVTPIGRTRGLAFRNTNRLIRFADSRWDIEISKTGYLNEAGRCLAMLTVIDQQPIVMVMLNGRDKLAPIRDADKIRRWVEKGINSARQLASR
jgi:D-alanyl-D-alanine endopeptidase (penicillin-binding protein 7)